jgi:dihydroorotase
MGTSNENAAEVLKTNDKKDRVCGIKIFMGSSTGGLLVNNPRSLDHIFRESEVLVATHCEDEKIIQHYLEQLRASGKTITAADHALIRNEESCFESSFNAIQFAKKHNTRLHILHISTERELQLFSNLLPLKEKRITAEVCVHHLHFTADDYSQLGYRIKCNPAIKAAHNKEALWKALHDDRLDIIATDHAPHTLIEKGYFRTENGMLAALPLEEVTYDKAHAGLPLIQHSLLLMLHYVKEGKLTMEKLVEKMCHAPAICFQIAERGFIRESYFADLVLLNNNSTRIEPNTILYKCGWSPLEGVELPGSIEYTFVNGHPVYGKGSWNESYWGQRLLFNRN